MKSKFSIALLFCGLMLLSCNTSDSSPDPDIEDDGSQNPPPTGQITVMEAFPDLRFSRPVDFQSPEDGTDRVFVVEQPGVIRVFDNDSSSSDAQVFLDITTRVDDSESEMGLLGLAFPPDYVSNGFFYVYYTSNRTRAVISRFSVSGNDQNVADAGSELELLEIAQPFTNHNGGQLAFGPDGFLYIASGDGGSGGDPQGNAQNRTNLLGAILRIDVNGAQNGNNYAIPTDNPFAGSSAFRPEIFAYGLRNPWRMSFDAQTGLLWTGDVGQNRLEEINVIESGGNYGWNIQEGFDCFQASTCDTANLTQPVFDYDHQSGDVSITGGYVYRGDALPELRGRYIYADFQSGRIWSLNANLQEDRDNQLIQNTSLNIASFGTDTQHELYICSFDGAIYRFALE